MSCAALLAEDLSEDAVLGGRLRLRQFKRGHRFGHDAILLAAACPGKPGERAADLGAGVGAAGLALAARVAGIYVTLVEIDMRLAALAATNAQLNGLSERVRIANVDVLAPAAVLAGTGLGAGSLARVLMNPPFNDPKRLKPSRDLARRLAHAAPFGTLAAWVATAARLLRASGTLALMWRASGLEEVLQSLGPPFGGVMVLPIHPRPGKAAVRLLIRATKGSRAPLSLLPGLFLNDDRGGASAQAEWVLREGAALPLAET